MPRKILKLLADAVLGMRPSRTTRPPRRILHGRFIPVGISKVRGGSLFSPTLRPGARAGTQGNQLIHCRPIAPDHCGRTYNRTHQNRSRFDAAAGKHDRVVNADRRVHRRPRFDQRKHRRPIFRQRIENGRLARSATMVIVQCLDVSLERSDRQTGRPPAFDYPHVKLAGNQGQALFLHVHEALRGKEAERFARDEHDAAGRSIVVADDGDIAALLRQSGKNQREGIEQDLGAVDDENQVVVLVAVADVAKDSAGPAIFRQVALDAIAPTYCDRPIAAQGSVDRP